MVFKTTVYDDSELYLHFGLPVMLNLDQTPEPALNLSNIKKNQIWIFEYYSTKFFSSLEPGSLHCNTEDFEFVLVSSRGNQPQVLERLDSDEHCGNMCAWSLCRKLYPISSHPSSWDAMLWREALVEGYN